MPEGRGHRFLCMLADCRSHVLVWVEARLVAEGSVARGMQQRERERGVKFIATNDVINAQC